MVDKNYSTMPEKDRETTVVTTDRGSGSGAGWFFVGAFVVLAVILGYFYLGTTDDKKIDVSVDLPKVEQPTTGAPAGDAPASGEQSNQ
jgi:hypothetical protein